MTTPADHSLTDLLLTLLRVHGELGLEVTVDGGSHFVLTARGPQGAVIETWGSRSDYLEGREPEGVEIHE